LKAVADRTGMDKTTVARLALHSGLVAISKTLPSSPAVEDVNSTTEAQ
jgi:hypothetical protein